VSVRVFDHRFPRRRGTNVLATSMDPIITVATTIVSATVIRPAFHGTSLRTKGSVL
jgi:hypothetical protein